MRLMAIVAISAGLVVLSGCATDNRIVGNRLTQSGHWYGNMGITGTLNNVTIEERSRINRLSIVGDANIVNVDENVTMGKIEVWGNNNTISLPERLARFVRFSQVGKNTIVQRNGQGTQAVSPREAIDTSPEVLERPQPQPSPSNGGGTTSPPPSHESGAAPAEETSAPAANPYITYDNPPRNVPPAGVSPGQQ